MGFGPSKNTRWIVKKLVLFGTCVFGCNIVSVNNEAGESRGTIENMD